MISLAVCDFGSLGSRHPGNLGWRSDPLLTLFGTNRMGCEVTTIEFHSINGDDSVMATDALAESNGRANVV